jgi:hypothetical protein
MALKYLTEFYTYKFFQPGSNRVVADPSTALELQIQAYIQSGHAAFFEGKYAEGLNAYLCAWGLLPKFVFEFFPAAAATIAEKQLLEVSLEKQLLQASGAILRYRDAVGLEVPITTPVDPPPSLLKIAEQINGEIDPAIQSLQKGTALALMGEFKAAQKNIKKALKAGNNDLELQAKARSVLALMHLRQGNYNSAQKELDLAGKLYSETKQSNGIAAMQHNSGVSLSLSGKVEEAGKLFAAAAVHAPIVSNWQATHSLNPGIGSITRPAGQAGMPFLFENYQGNWIETSSAVLEKPKGSVNLIWNGAHVQIELGAGGTSSIESQLLIPRIEATTLSELNSYWAYWPQFVTYLCHIQGFVLPLALGDTYFALGDYEKAALYYGSVKNYTYLNRAIERPMVWRKLAQTYLQWGNHLYRERDHSGAQAQYERIVKLTGSGFSLTGPLYTGTFSALKTEALAFLNDPDPLAFSAIEYARRIIILEALSNLRQILNGINYLGFPEDIIPIHSWRYLQNVARYFANQAIQAERAYISFKDSAEREEFTRLALEQAVDAQEAALNVEEKRVLASEEQRRVAELSATLAQTRLDNANEQKADYDSTSAKLATLEEITAWATGPMDRAEVSPSYADALGISPGTYDTYHVTAYAARKRSEISRAYELRNMQRRIDELADAKAVADAQVDVANKMVDVAQAQRDLAHLRKQQAEAQLDFFDAQEFTPELWDNLAQAQKEISRRYLDWAIGAAFLMERAFEFEYDTNINRIRFDYERSELHGLLSADFLLADIDQFSYDRLLETEKQVPVKVDIALAERYPFQFYRQFQQTGRIDFDTLLDDFDHWHPGNHLRKLRRVEVVVEGVIGSQGLHGTLANSGISYFRDRDGQRKMRIQKPETLILSRFDIRHDGFVFTYDEDVLQIFENSGVASGWTLDFPSASNDVNYKDITNIHVVFYYDPYYSDAVANMVRAEMAATAIYEHKLGLALRFQYPDEFFDFQDTGEVTCLIDHAYLPYPHTDPHILEAYLVVETEEGTSPENLVVEISSVGSGLNISDTTDADGMINTDAAAVPLNALREQPLMDTWTFRIPEAANAAAFAAGFTWEKVRNIYFYVDYLYTPFGLPAASSDDFSADSLSEFDVVDDTAATSSAPSNWIYDGPNQLIKQTSNIFGSTAGDPPTAVHKPGSYLVHKTSAQWPEVQNLVLSCRLNSTDDDGIGVVFRYKDSDNFYFFLMDAQRQYRRLGKKEGGVFKELQIPALDTSDGYNVNQDYDLVVAAVNDAFKVFLDNVEILSGRDQSFLEAGKVGFYAWGNTGAHFHNLTLQSI